MELEHVSLETLGKGAAQEKFEFALKEVLANIRDPNTNWKTKRRITLTIDFIPKENRAEADLVTNAVSKLSPTMPVVSTIFFGVKDGQMQAAEIRQDELFTPEKETKPTLIKKEG